MIWDALLRGLMATFSLPVLGAITLGVSLGVIFGAIPGLTATLGIALLLPFIYGLAPTTAFAIMLSVVSAVHTSNTFPAFFFNVPGSPSASATILDGYPMAKNGEAAEGLTAAFVVSAIGGIIGALILCSFLPLLQPLVLMFASPERFMLVLLGLVMISFLSGERPTRGLLSAAMGLWLGTIGMDPQLGIPRYTLGQDYLLEGLSLIPLVMGLFALPEVVALAVRGQIAEKAAMDVSSGFLTGVRAAFRHWILVVQSSVIGVIVGAIPGLGGTAAAFYAYGVAVRGAKEKEREKFGKGEIRGVIAPESANNASAGGELIPTLAFGVPGGATSAMLLAAFLVLGITPGPPMLHEYLWISFAMVFTLVVSNLLATAICVCITRPAAKIAWIRGSLIIPVIMLFVLFGAYAAYSDPGTLVFTLLFGFLGYLMMRAEWPRVPLLLGFILGPLSENFLFISIKSYGVGFLLRPITTVILLMILGIIAYGFLLRLKK
ncbi:MAG TPA: tripartite tricarboxylate transporter permease [Terriglobales bacterium]|nr:tripartite tricarboxylate transporter permease [Terriglobales bacterium]